MKRSILLFILLIAAICTFGQSTDSTATVTYTAGDTILEFLSKNAWSLALGAFFILSEWLGNTKKVKESSVIAWIINAEEVRQWLIKNKNWWPYPIRLEEGTSWVHLDVRDGDQGKVYVFKP